MDVVKPDYASYKHHVSELLNTPEHLPHLPSIVMDIRQALLRSDCSVSSLSRLIEGDRELSNLLLRYATSVMMHNQMPPQSVFDVVRALGMSQVERIAVLHAVKGLFSGNTQAYTRIFVACWDRLINKAAMSALIAKKVGGVAPDNALLGSVLSEVGLLAVLSAFRESSLGVPNAEMFISLCREFSKTMSITLLKHWGMDEGYAQLARQSGNWQAGEHEPFGLLDIVSLGTYHSQKMRATATRLPPIAHLASYQKLSEKRNAITDTNELELVVMHRDDVRAIADSLY